MNRKFPYFLVALVASVVVGSTANAQAAPSTQDVTFMRTAAVGGYAEIAEAGTALKNSSNAEVKTFARTMIADHGKAGKQLSAIAKAQGISLPTAVGPEDAKMRGTLEGMRGKAFDTAYLQHQRLAHEKTVAAFQKEAAQGTDATVVAFAKKTLPVVEAHLRSDIRDLKMTGA